MARLSHLRSLQALEAAVRCGSFTAAADELGITAAAVGQRVKALEDYLGLELLDRTRSGTRATSALDDALSALTQAFAALEHVAVTLADQRIGDVKVIAPADVIELWLMPRADQFRSNYPNIRLLVGEEGGAEAGPAGCDVRIGFGLQPSAAHDVLFHDMVVPIASRGNIERLSQADPVLRLEGFPLLHLDLYRDDPAGTSWPAWLSKNQIARNAPERGMRFHRVGAALDAVAADAGIALCGLALAADALEIGQVCLAWPPSQGQRCSLPLVANYSSQTNPAARLFREWLLTQGVQTQAWIEAQVKQ